MGEITTRFTVYFFTFHQRLPAYDLINVTECNLPAGGPSCGDCLKDESKPPAKLNK